MPKAASLAEAIHHEFNVNPELIEGKGGVFDVRVNGTLIFSKHQMDRFPEHKEILDQMLGLSGKRRPDTP